MPCESCGVQFSVFRRKRACSECERLYCAACLRRGGGMCAPCRALSTRPLVRHSIAHLKARDLQCFLQRQNVSTRGCVEKEELVSLCVTHVNSMAYRRRGTNGNDSRNSGPFTTLKGFTNNINDIINSAFDLRPNATPQPSNTYSACYNAGHAHSHAGSAAPQPAQPPQPQPPPRERFTVNPGGERDPREGAGAGGDEGGGEGGITHSSSSSSGASAGGARLDTADCFEVEDLDDSGWEFVNKPADPLPGDSEVLIAPNTDVPAPPEAPRPQPQPQPRERAATRQSAAARDVRSSSEVPYDRATERLRAPAPYGSPQRAASELELRSESADTASDSTSLQDEPMMDQERESTPAAVTLESIADERALSALSVRQLKELLARNRVEFRGCLERRDLLARATTLYRDHIKYKDGMCRYSS
ncbi:E3 ubiquitin-protein ligase rififylin [Phthorimaea operculella]|nr:E3 ubiquitin-protein ligase rififylin [Phthorimaea operculella]